MRKIPKNLKKFSPLLMVAVLSSFTLIALGRKLPQSDTVPKVVEAEEIQTEIETVSETQPETLLDTTEPLQLSFPIQDGEYEGIGVGYAGNIKVLVTIQNNRIVEIQVLEEQDSTAFEGAEGFFRNAQRVIPTILEQQDWEVDTISGATFSSRGIISAVRNALTGEVDSNIPEVQPFTAPVVSEITQPIFEDAPSSSNAKYRDGIFTGKGFGFGGEMSVSVNIVQGQITDISIMENQETPEYLDLAKQITNFIVSAQSTNVDAVSGATLSSNGILQAVNSALNQARTTEAQGNDSYYIDNIDRNTGFSEITSVSQDSVSAPMWETESKNAIHEVLAESLPEKTEIPQANPSFDEEHMKAIIRETLTEVLPDNADTIRLAVQTAVSSVQAENQNPPENHFDIQQQTEIIRNAIHEALTESLPEKTEISQASPSFDEEHMKAIIRETLTEVLPDNADTIRLAVQTAVSSVQAENQNPPENHFDIQQVIQEETSQQLKQLKNDIQEILSQVQPVTVVSGEENHTDISEAVKIAIQQGMPDNADTIRIAVQTAVASVQADNAEFVRKSVGEITDILNQENQQSLTTQINDMKTELYFSLL